MVTIGGIEAFEEAGMPEHASESRRSAVGLLRSIGHDADADKIAAGMPPHTEGPRSNP
jgi:hypothetical protein